VSRDALADATKDELVLTMLAVMGGDRTEVNERDLFLASWHAFPNTMRWVDTPLPNPDTFTASLRRLDQRGYIERQNKQQRQKGGRRRKTTLDPARSGVVKARIAEGALERAGIGQELIAEVRRLQPDAEATRELSDGALIALCVGLRTDESRHLDEGVLVELAFHKFPSRFAYAQRREFPDTERVRAALAEARGDGLLDEYFGLTPKGLEAVEGWKGKLNVRLDASQAHESGDLRFAARVERSAGYQAYAENGTLVRTKPDELFRALRVPPTTDPQPVASALASRVMAMRRIDRGNVAEYLLKVADRHNPKAVALVESNGASAVPLGDTADQG
jgi:hypothetical protein